jgi:hypothetical protein
MVGISVLSAFIGGSRLAAKWRRLYSWAWRQGLHGFSRNVGA